MYSYDSDLHVHTMTGGQNHEVITRPRGASLLPLGALNPFPFTHCQYPQKRLAKGPSTADHMPLPHRFAAWLLCLPYYLSHMSRHISSPIYVNGPGSLWLCRPVRPLSPSCSPPNQRGQGRNYSGPPLCAESACMKIIAWGTSLERASCLHRSLLMTEEWTENNAYCKRMGCYLICNPGCGMVRLCP